MTLKVFDFYCGACGETSELWLRSDEAPMCPECGSYELTKIFTKVPGNHKAKEPYDKLDTYHDYLTKPIRSSVPKNYRKVNGTKRLSD